MEYTDTSAIQLQSNTTEQLALVEIASSLETFLRPDQVLTRPIERIAYAHDASCYRLVPQAIVRPDSLDDVRRLYGLASLVPPALGSPWLMGGAMAAMVASRSRSANTREKFAAGIDKLTLHSGGNTVTASGLESISGGAGADNLQGQIGNDTLLGGAGNDILLFGRESAGVPDHVHDRADHRVLIPMVDGQRSINVAMSAAMITGEALRQTGFPSRA
mgnify:CR=1 FL=1